MFCTTLPLDDRLLSGADPSDKVNVAISSVNITYIIYPGTVLAMPNDTQGYEGEYNIGLGVYPIGSLVLWEKGT